MRNDEVKNTNGTSAAARARQAIVDSGLDLQKRLPHGSVKTLAQQSGVKYTIITDALRSLRGAQGIYLNDDGPKSLASPGWASEVPESGLTKEEIGAALSLALKDGEMPGVPFARRAAVLRRALRIIKALTEFDEEAGE